MTSPFRPYSESSYGTNASSSDEPLRMRRSEYFASPEGSLGEFPTYPPYSELPFTSLKRRKQGNTFVKWSMRAVLASPIVVLVLWSTCAIIFTSQQTSQIKPTSRQHKHSKAKIAKPQVQYMSPQGGIPPPPQGNGYGGGYLLQPQVAPDPYAAAQPGQFLAVQPNLVPPEQYLAPQPLLGVPSNPLPPNPVQAEQPLALPQNVITPEQFMAKRIPLIGPLGATNTPPQILLQPHAQLPEPPQPLGESQAPPLGDVLPEPPLAATDSSRAVGHRPPPRGDVLPEPPLAAVGYGDSGQPLGATGYGDRGRPSVHLRPQQRQQVYYYDPQEATTNGQFQIPSTVYDKEGHAIPLQALQGAQIFLEPPTQQLEPPQQLAVTQMHQWGESTTQDQTIIVSTVAVMALLVGALSARRMRSRSFLSSCIENESLEDDVAYDTAYTTTDNSYNTFGGWKGDLEKFDV